MIKKTLIFFLFILFVLFSVSFVSAELPFVRLGEEGATYITNLVGANASTIPCGNITGATSDLCTIVDTGGTNCSVDGSCPYIVYSSNTSWITDNQFYNTSQGIFNVIDNGTFAYVGSLYDDDWINDTFYNQTDIDNKLSGLNNLSFDDVDNDTFLYITDWTNYSDSWINETFYNQTDIDNKLSGLNNLSFDDIDNDTFLYITDWTNYSDSWINETFDNYYLASVVDGINNLTNYYTTTLIDNKLAGLINLSFDDVDNGTFAYVGSLYNDDWINDTFYNQSTIIDMINSNVTLINTNILLNISEVGHNISTLQNISFDDIDNNTFLYITDWTNYSDGWINETFYNQTDIDNKLSGMNNLSFDDIDNGTFAYVGSLYDDDWINETFYNQTDIDNKLSGLNNLSFDDIDNNTFLYITDWTNYSDSWINDTFYNQSTIIDMINSNVTLINTNILLNISAVGHNISTLANISFDDIDNNTFLYITDWTNYSDTWINVTFYNQSTITDMINSNVTLINTNILLNISAVGHNISTLTNLSFEDINNSFGNWSQDKPYYIDGNNFTNWVNASGFIINQTDVYTSDEIYINKNTSNSFNLNATKLLETTYYNATQSTTIAGTINGGTLANTQHPDAKYDGITFNFSEVAGSPGLDLRINFTGVDSFNRGLIRYKTSSLSGSYPVIQVWNVDDSVWEDYPPFAESLTFATITQPVFDWSDHVDINEVVQMRLYKASNGNTNNHYYVDWVSVVSGAGVPSGEEVDPYSIHTDAINKTHFFYNGTLHLNETYLNTLYANKAYVDDVINSNISAVGHNISTLANISFNDIDNDTFLYITDWTNYSDSWINDTFYNQTDINNKLSGLNNLSFDDVDNDTFLYITDWVNYSDSWINETFYNQTDIDNKLSGLNNLSFDDIDNDTFLYITDWTNYSDSWINETFYNQTDIDNKLSGLNNLSFDDIDNGTFAYAGDTYDDDWINDTFYNQTDIDNKLSGLNNLSFDDVDNDTFLYITDWTNYSDSWINETFYNQTDIDNKLSGLNNLSFDDVDNDTFLYITDWVNYSDSWINETFYNQTDIDNKLSGLNNLSFDDIDNDTFLYITDWVNYSDSWINDTFYNQSTIIDMINSNVTLINTNILLNISEVGHNISTLSNISFDDIDNGTFAYAAGVDGNFSIVGNLSIGDSDEDNTIYFYEDGGFNENISWNDALDAFIFSDELRVADDLIVGGYITAGGTISSSSDIYTIGSGDDLWLGHSTQSSALFRAYADGDLYNLRINATTINASVFYQNGELLTAYSDDWINETLDNYYLASIIDGLDNLTNYYTTTLIDNKLAGLINLSFDDVDNDTFLYITDWTNYSDSWINETFYNQSVIDDVINSNISAVGHNISTLANISFNDVDNDTFLYITDWTNYSDSWINETFYNQSLIVELINSNVTLINTNILLNISAVGHNISTLSNISFSDVDNGTFALLASNNTFTQNISAGYYNNRIWNTTTVDGAFLITEVFG